MDAKAAARIEALTHAMGWEDLKQELAVQEEKFWQRHIVDVKAGKPIDQRELDRALGKLDGIRTLLNAPVKAAKIMAVNESKEEPVE